MAGRLKLRRTDEGRYGDPPVQRPRHRVPARAATHSVRSRMLRPKIDGEISLRPPPQVYKILWKELNEEEGLWQVMPAEKKPHRASSAALAHLDELLDEALEQTFPASDAVAIDIDIERESHERGARVLDSRTPLAGNRKVG